MEVSQDVFVVSVTVVGATVRRRSELQNNQIG